MIEQRTLEWYQARRGRFTASTFGDIMTNPADKTLSISKTAMKRIKEAAFEWKIENNRKEKEKKQAQEEKTSSPHVTLKNRLPFGNFIMEERKPVPVQWGIDHEEAGLDLFIKTTGWNIKDGGFLVHKTLNDIGATPDAFVMEGDQFLETVQIKCPYNPSIHQKYLTKIKNAADLKSIAKKYYWQVQGEMWVTGVSAAWFVSYDPRASRDERMFYVKILRNDDDLTLLKKRLMNALLLRDSLLK